MKFTEGVFLKELNNRFQALVLINNIEEICYVATSCNLRNFIELEGKKVLLTESKTKSAKLRYSLFAVLDNYKYIILNSSFANEIIKKELKSSLFDFLGSRDIICSEKKIDSYKSDLYINTTKSIVEIKSFISVHTEELFPQLKSIHMKKQFADLLNLLRAGYKVYYFIVSFNDVTQKIFLNKNNFYGSIIKDCIREGLIFKIFYATLDQNKESILEKSSAEIISG